MWAYFLKYIFVNVLGKSYVLFLGVYLGLFLVLGILIYAFVKEAEMPEKEALPCCEEVS